MSDELRFDQGQIELVSEDGFLRAKVFLTKPGVYPYLLSNGTISSEAKLREDLFADVVLKKIHLAKRFNS